MKLCSRCQTPKPLSQFRTDSRLASGLAAKCKKCSQKECRTWRNSQPKSGLIRLSSSDPDYTKKRRAKWRGANKSAHAAHNKAWRKAHPEACRALGAKKRARRKGANGAFTASEISELFAKQGGKCPACRERLVPGYHRDHILPLALGGDNTINNIQLLCPPCNLSKGHKHPIEWALQSGRLV